MMQNTAGIPASPMLPRPLALPLGLLPRRLNSAVLAKALNRIFAPELADGELEFMEGKVMRVHVADAGMSFYLTLEDGAMKTATAHQPHDLSIEGSIYDFLLLATRREDADTLFFNRRLRLGGDTELGLYVKNFLDALELDGRLGPLQKVLDGLTQVIGRFAS